MKRNGDGEAGRPEANANKIEFGIKRREQKIRRSVVIAFLHPRSEELATQRWLVRAIGIDTCIDITGRLRVAFKATAIACWAPTREHGASVLALSSLRVTMTSTARLETEA